MPLPKPFPQLDLANEDSNPGIRLFGRRFYTDQTIMELLAEFLLVANSGKQIGKNNDLETFHSMLPARDQLTNWQSGQALGYKAPIRLNLKLFAFLGASKLETRHDSHKQQYKNILRRLKDAILTDGTIDKDDILKSLENLFLGFQGVGINRTWCTQVFLPISDALLARETNWQQTQAERASVTQWADTHQFFSSTQKLFMARGGELLYLQICNALRQNGPVLNKFLANMDLSDEEKDPVQLHAALENNLKNLTNGVPPALDAIASLIDKIDAAANLNNNDEPIWCAWCPEESWREGYLFAVEVNRLCQAVIDPVDRIELLMIGCALQVLRSLCAQSVRYAPYTDANKSHASVLEYAMIISTPDGRDKNKKHLSQRNLQIILRTIHQALRDSDISANAQNGSKSRESLYREADTRYGHKLFLSLAKKIGLIVPQRGPGARLIFNDKILRYLVLTLIRPGERRTYDDFKMSLFEHHGMAIEGIEIEQASAWAEFPKIDTGAAVQTTWLADMLKASGFLIHLSDACSLVHNPFDLDKGCKS